VPLWLTLFRVEYEDRVNHRGTEALRKQEKEEFFGFKTGDNFQGFMTGDDGQCRRIRIFDTESGICQTLITSSFE
jgi:hypothetical protein